MSTVLSTHPPQQTGAAPARDAARFRSRRPSVLDRLALRLGLLLITYGRRRNALSHDDLARHAEITRARQLHELAWDRDRRLAVPPR